MDALGTETYELLRDAYQVIDGIPDRKLDLGLWQNTKFTTEVDCGTIACAAGFLTMHPGFQELGLSAINPSGAPIFADKSEFHALANFFGLELHEACDIFRGRLSEGTGLTDREVWLARVRKFLASKDAPDNQYCAQA